MKRFHSNFGGTLIVALIAILIVSAAVGIAVNSTGTTERLTDRSRDLIEARLAAEGAIEYAYGIWKKRVQAQDRAISSSEAMANFAAPAFSGFSYLPAANFGPLTIAATDAYGAPMSSPSAAPPAVSVSIPNYPGWRGYAYNYVATARLQQSSPRGLAVQAGVKRRFQYLHVPLFQSMFFFQDDLEIYRPAPMTIGGLIHTNANLYLSADPGSLTILNDVSYVGNYSPNPPPGASSWSGYAGTVSPPTYAGGGFNAQVHQTSAFQPLGTDISTVLNTTDSNPNNDSLHELIEPPNPSFSDPTQIANRRLYNKAGIIVTISGTTKTIITQNGTSLTASQNTAIKNAISSTSTIYDQREGKNVTVDNINVGALTPVLNAASNFNGVLYVQDTTSSTTPRAIRLQNGGVLPDNGLTIASQNPVYVQGDYNTGTTRNPLSVPANATGNPNDTDSPTVTGYTRKPAAIAADAVMLLSNSWLDTNSSLDLSARVATNTTYNFALLSGFVPSLYQPSNGGAQYGYSGGANNFPRLLEDWSAATMTYYGSMVELFQSKTFTGKWDTANIYAPPNRRWNFDPNFTNNPPPGSLDAVLFSRGSWSRF